MGSRIRIVAVVMALGIGGFLPHRGWGQATERIGTVLVVEGTAEVRAQDAAEWERLRFRDKVFLNDTVRTAENSKIKVLLRDDSIMTLAERSEMQFTEFLLTPQQRNTVVNLVIGKIRVLTTRIFGAGSATEVHTPNAVAGVRGSEENVEYDDAAQNTRVLCLSAGSADHCYLRDPQDPTKVLNVPEGHIAEQIGIELPVSTRPATPVERQEMIRGTAAITQVPGAVQTAEQLEQSESAEPSERTELLPMPSIEQELAPAPEPPPEVDTPVSLEPPAAPPIEPPTEPPITPDNPVTEEMLRETRLQLIIEIPR
jgi:hypothetical protein